MIRSNAPKSLIAKSNWATAAACQKVIDRARAANTKIVIWRDDKIVKLSPDEATIELESNLAEQNSKHTS